jgi:uncharacterized repeat protein (TIGR03803 family)
MMIAQGQIAVLIFETFRKHVTALLLALAMIAFPAAHAQTYSVLHTFTGGSDGGQPYAGLTMDAAGNSYGATFSGGNGYGVVFKLTREGSGWIQTTLYEFRGGEDGMQADGGVTIGPDGALYGTTFQGGGYGCFGIGCGIVYRLTPPATFCRSISCPWTETVLHRFGLADGDGALPVYGSPVFDRAGNLYGTTKSGGTLGEGTVYELTHSSGGWTENVLWSFGGDSGEQPVNSLIFDGTGNLYGTAAAGGVYTGGTVFELSPSGSGWAETNLFSFNNYSTGSSPVGGLAWDAQGSLYGTTQFGGRYDYGTAFQLAPSVGGWTYTQLATFLCCGGPTSTPSLDSAGNVYVSVGLTGDEGAIVELTHSDGAWTSTTLHSFHRSDGSDPIGGVVFDARGNVYGTTFAGGTNGQGVIFEITP